MSQQYEIPKARPLNTSGKVIPGCKLYFYLPDTTTAVTVYSDDNATVASANPLTADDNGEFAPVYITQSVDSVLRTSGGALVWGPFTTPYNLGFDPIASETSFGITVSDRRYPVGNVKRYGAVGNGTTDDTAAIQAAINYCRDNALTLTFPTGLYRTTSTLVTQYDGSYALTSWVFDGATIIADFTGSTALSVTGGAYTQRIQGIALRPSNTYAMTGANYDTTTHGITVTNAVADIKADISNFKGYGLNIVSSAANSNTSRYDVNIQTCGNGVYCSGTNDNLSVVQGRFWVYNCAKTAFYGDVGCLIRQWQVWIYAESNCTAVTATAAVTVNNATNGEWWIYSEQTNAANEIDFSAATNTGNFIQSARYNKDTYANGNLVFAAGDFRRSNLQTWTPTIGGSTTAGTQAYSVQKGSWVREGNVVTIWGVITLTAKDAATAGNLRIFGLPVAPSSTLTGMVYPITIGEQDNFTLTAGKLATVLQATPGNTYLSFLDVVSAGAATNTPVAAFSATTTLVFSGRYIV